MVQSKFTLADHLACMGYMAWDISDPTTHFTQIDPSSLLRPPYGFETARERSSKAADDILIRISTLIGPCQNQYLMTVRLWTCLDVFFMCTGLPIV